MILYLHELLEHQRVYDSTNNKLYLDTPITHVFMKEVIYWGCAYPTKRHLLTREVTRYHTQSERVIDETVHHTREHEEKTFVPVTLAGQTWMSVHRASEFESWVKDEGTDETYRQDLMSLGIQDTEFKFSRKNKAPKEKLPPTPKPRQNYIVRVGTPMTPARIVVSLADGWTTDGLPWFANDESYQYALHALAIAYPPKKKKSKALTSVPYLTGSAMGYLEDSQSKGKMLQGKYIKVLA